MGGKRITEGKWVLDYLSLIITQGGYEQPKKRKELEGNEQVLGLGQSDCLENLILSKWR